jgi:hypothetical protein
MDEGLAYTLARLNITSRALYDKLKEAKIGDLLTWDELRDVAGMDVRPSVNPKGYAALKKARDLLVLSEGMFFDAVVGKGLQRISEEDVAMSSSRYIKRIRTTARKGRITLQCCVREPDKLTPAAQQEAMANIAYLGVISFFSNQKRLDAVAPQISRGMDALGALKLFITQDKEA